MMPIKVRLEPSNDLQHSRLRLTLDLEAPLKSWQLKDFASMLQAFSRRQTCIVLSAAAPAEWLDEWSLALEESELDVEFRLSRRRHLAG